MDFTENDKVVFDNALSGLLDIAGVGLVDLANRRVVKNRNVALDTQFFVQEASAAALTASGLLAADRIGSEAPIEVDIRLSEASLQSHLLFQFDDPERAPGFLEFPFGTDFINGFHQTGDGRWMYFHHAFPEHAERLVEFFQHPKSQEEADQAFQKWNATDLEQVAMACGLCGVMVRSAEEWDACQQGIINKMRPVVEIIRVDDAAPRKPHPSARPLDDCNVLDLTRVLAGPIAARTLASYGANVLRVSSPEMAHFPIEVPVTGLGKKSTYLNINENKGRDTLIGLIEQSDIFFQSYRSGALEKMGLGFCHVARMKPGIVYVSVNCFGHEGPWRSVRGWEQLAQAVTGMASAHGEYCNDGVPALQYPAAVNDYTTGYLAAYGAMAALRHQEMYGGSYLVRVSLVQTCAWTRSLGMRSVVACEPFSESELVGMRDSTDSEWGAMHFLKPAISISDCDIYWSTPPVPLGTHPPSF